MELFEKYTEKDEFIVKELSKLKLFLIGGTAIDFWCRKLHLKPWRSRSNNDIDFYTPASNKYGIKSVITFLRQNEFDDIAQDAFIIHAQNVDKTIEVDVLIDNETLPPYLFKKDSGICVMSPIFLFASKFDRFINTYDGQRRKTDRMDLLQLMDIIVKMKLVDNFEKFLQTRHYDENAQSIIDTLIQTYNEKYS